MHFRLQWLPLYAVLCLLATKVRQSNARLRHATRALQTVNCSSNTVYYHKMVSFDVNKVIHQLTTGEVELLEELFTNSYNTAVDQICDAPYFRRAVDAHLLNTYCNSANQFPGIRRLQGVDASLNYTSIIYNVTFACQGCPPDAQKVFASLNFVPNTTTGYTSSTSQSTQNLNDVCYCSVNGPQYSRTPTQMEFNNDINQAFHVVPSLFYNLQNVSVIEKAEELEPHICNQPTSNFYTVVLMEIDADPTTLSNDELQTLVDLFIQTYNDMSFSHCDDPLFRRVASVSIDAKTREIRRRVQALPEFTVESNYLIFNLTMFCQNCEEETKAFDTVASSSTSNFTSPPSRRLYSASRSLQMDHTGTRRLQQIENIPCYCPASDPNKGLPLTTSEFRVLYLEKIYAVKNQTNNQLFGSLNRIYKVVEVDLYDCSPTITNPKTTILLGFTPNSLDAGFQSGIGVLEQLIKSTYNEISFESCDVPYFRRITNVTSAFDSSGRRLQQVPKFNGNPALLFNVGLSCRNCPPETNAFKYTGNVGSSSSKKKSSSRFLQDALIEFDGRQLQQTIPFSFGCYCESSNTSTRELSLNEFQDTLINRVKTIQDETNLLDSFGNITGAFEINQFDCTSAFNSYSEVVPIAFDGNAAQVTSNEITILEGAFTGSYNRVSFRVCDAPYFRNMYNADLIIDDRRVRKLMQGHRNDQETTQPILDDRFFYGFFFTDYKCQCSQEQSLFTGDVGSSNTTTPSQRMLNEEDDLDQLNYYNSDAAAYSLLSDRLLQENPGVCFCSAQAENSNEKLTREAVIQEYNNTILSLKAQGFLPNINSLADLPLSYFEFSKDSPTGSQAIPNSPVSFPTRLPLPSPVAQSSEIGFPTRSPIVFNNGGPTRSSGSQPQPPIPAANPPASSSSNVVDCTINQDFVATTCVQIHAIAIGTPQYSLEDDITSRFTNAYEGNGLCDPFDRQIQSIACKPTSVGTDAHCTIEWSCNGPCQTFGVSSLFRAEPDAGLAVVSGKGCNCENSAVSQNRVPTYDEFLHTLNALNTDCANKGSCYVYNVAKEASDCSILYTENLNQSAPITVDCSTGSGPTFDSYTYYVFPVLNVVGTPHFDAATDLNFRLVSTYASSFSNDKCDVFGRRLDGITCTVQGPSRNQLCCDLAWVCNGPCSVYDITSPFGNADKVYTPVSGTGCNCEGLVATRAATGLEFIDAVNGKCLSEGSNCYIYGPPRSSVDCVPH